MAMVVNYGSMESGESVFRPANFSAYGVFNGVANSRTDSDSLDRFCIEISGM
jgi:hypothetical protein